MERKREPPEFELEATESNKKSRVFVELDEEHYLLGCFPFMSSVASR